MEELWNEGERVRNLAGRCLEGSEVAVFVTNSLSVHRHIGCVGGRSCLHRWCRWLSCAFLLTSAAIFARSENCGHSAVLASICERQSASASNRVGSWEWGVGCDTGLRLPAGLNSGARCRNALSRLRLSGSAEEDAKAEARKWAEMAARMKAQRAAAAGASVEPAPPMEGQPGFVPGTGKASLGVDDLKKLEGKVLPAPALGELETLMAKAEAFKEKEQARRKQPTARPGGSGPTLAGDKAPARLVGGDAGSLRQAAPFQPGESKAGNIEKY